MSRLTEAEIAELVVAVLEDSPFGDATIAELVEKIPNRVTLSVEDLAPSPTRAGEAMWEQQVRNIRSHHNSPGTAMHDGKLEATDGGFRLPVKVKSPEN